MAIIWRDYYHEKGNQGLVKLLSSSIEHSASMFTHNHGKAYLKIWKYFLPNSKSCCNFISFKSQTCFHGCVKATTFFRHLLGLENCWSKTQWVPCSYNCRRTWELGPTSLASEHGNWIHVCRIKMMTVRWFQLTGYRSLTFSQVSPRGNLSVIVGFLLYKSMKSRLSPLYPH